MAETDSDITVLFQNPYDLVDEFVQNGYADDYDCDDDADDKTVVQEDARPDLRGKHFYA